MTPEEIRFFNLANDHAYRHFAMWLLSMEPDASTGLYTLKFGEPGRLKRTVGVFKEDVLKDAAANALSEDTAAGAGQDRTTYLRQSRR